MTQEDWILIVVQSFYDKARVDVLIGYHFRNIQDFDEHIPRIAIFWEIQLIGSTKKNLTKPFDVLDVHRPLLIKRGELGRWLTLFRKTLDEKRGTFPELEIRWEERLLFFEKVFVRTFGL
jgi:truncated hemoglobin YjbI